MGVESIIRKDPNASALWSMIRVKLEEAGESPAMRMIDGELALPDEMPSEPWRELRIALQGGMITLRRLPEQIACVIWGNADDALLRSWHNVTWAVCAVTSGTIEGVGSANEFARQNNLRIAQSS